MLTLSSEITWGSKKLMDLPPKPRLLTLVALRSHGRSVLEFLQDFVQCFDRPRRESKAGTSKLACISKCLWAPDLSLLFTSWPLGRSLNLPRSHFLHVKHDTQWYQVIFKFLCRASFSESKNSTKQLHKVLQGSASRAPAKSGEQLYSSPAALLAFLLVSLS